MKRIIIILGLLVPFASLAQQERKNVLFIAIDDLKPLLGSYGDEIAITPTIDELSENSTVFTKAYCQQAVCGPSRASLLTGMRPDYTGVWDLKTRMRDINPDIISIPQYFRSKGYETVAVGKIYDPRCVDKKTYDDESWSIPYRESSQYTYPEEYGEPALSYYVDPKAKTIVEKYTKEAKEKGIENVHAYVSERYKPSVEYYDAPDEAYMDAQIAANSVKYLKQLAKKNEPFFLGVGFKRPHLPFAAPKKYWSMYNREDIPLAPYRKAIKNGTDIAYHNSGELESYTDIPELTDFSDIFNDNLPDWKQKELIHGYYACVSFIDAQLKIVLDELKELGLEENTIIVLWGDHGWHLGDHGLWCKHSNFEQATRVPMVFSVPGNEGRYNDTPVEFVDIFPTLCDAANIDIPSHLQGTSLMPIVKGEQDRVKEYAVSQFARGKSIQGYSIRDDRYRLTVWMEDNYKTFQRYDKSLIKAVELYDYQKDPNETINVYNMKKYSDAQGKLFEYLESYVTSQNEEVKGSGSVNFNAKRNSKKQK